MQKTDHQPDSMLKSLLSVQVLIGLLGMVVFYTTIVNPEESVLSGKALEQPVDDTAHVLTQADALKPSRLAASGKLTEAILSADQLLDEQPHDLATIVCGAKIHLKAGQPTDAFRSYKRALALAPRNRYIRIEFARALAANGKIEDALRQYNLLERQCPRWAEPRFELAQIYMLDNKPLEAANEFQELSKIRPNNSAVYKLRGIALTRAGRAQEGLDEYMNGLHVETKTGQPDAIKAILNIWGSLDKAKYDLERQVETNPDDPMIKLRLSYIYLYMNNTDEAKQSLQDARKLAPENAEIHRALCVVYQKLGDKSQAITEFRQSVALEKAVEDRNKKAAASI